MSVITVETSLNQKDENEIEFMLGVGLNKLSEYVHEG